MLATCFTCCERQWEAAHRQQTVVSVSKGKDIAQRTSPSTAASVGPDRAGVWVFTDGL